MVLEIRTHPDKGRGWFENPRFWRTSFVDGPFDFEIRDLVLPLFGFLCYFLYCIIIGGGGGA